MDEYRRSASCRIDSCICCGKLQFSATTTLDALVPGLLAALVLCGGVTVGIANRILRLADGRLNFALDLLNGASNLGTGVTGQVSGMPLCASHHLVDCALHSLLVHFFHLLGRMHLYAAGRWPIWNTKNIPSGFSPAKTSFPLAHFLFAQ
jgi:hypothetical protein